MRTVIPSWRLGAAFALLLMAALPAGAQTTFPNTDFIEFPSQPTTSGVAATYPSLRAVSALTGTITDVDVRINTLMHTWPAHLSLLLAGPGGQNIVLMDGDGNDNDVALVTMTFSDEGTAGPLPAPLVTGTFQPKGGFPDAAFPAPAPAASGSAALTVFDGTDPNGTWSLYVVDRANLNYGTLVGGWTLLFTTTTGTPAAQSNTSALQVPALVTASGAGDPYPSTNVVSGQPVVFDLDVRLNSLTHSFPSDVRLLLVGPAGQNIILMTSNGGGTDVGGLNLTFSDEAAGLPPNPLVTGTFRPQGGTTTSLPAPAPVGPYTSTALSVFDGTDPNGTWSLYAFDSAGGDVGAISDGWSLIFNVPPTTPVFALSPAAAANFGTATACSATRGSEQLFVVSNQGIGTLQVTGVTITGPNASSFSVEASPPFPMALTVGQSGRLLVRFAPPVGATPGAQTASLTVQYNDGTAQSSAPVALAGTVGTAANTSAGLGEGYRWVTSEGPCLPGGVAPAAFTPIPFGPAAGDTEVPDFLSDLALINNDDGSFRVDLAAAGFGPFRFFGKPYTELWINSNGNIFFDRLEDAFNVPFPATPTGVTRNAFIAALSDDFNPGTGRGGVASPPVGEIPVYFRAADITGPGGPPDGINEFIITYYRARRFGSTTDWATVQVILGLSGIPGGNGVVVIQYYNGLDPVDGQPYTSGATTAGSWNLDARVGLTGDQGFMSTLYRNDGVGGPLYGGPSHTVFFGPRSEQVLTGVAGWRLLTQGPGFNMNVADLAEQNLVQGISGEYDDAPAPPDGFNDNLYTEYNYNAFTGPPPTNTPASFGYAPPSSQVSLLEGGKGMFWYFFDFTLNPGLPSGTSESFELPAPLITGGTVQAAPVPTSINATVSPVPAGRFEMLGNPFEANLDVTTMATWGDSPVSGVGQIWDPSVSSYVLTTTNGNRVAMWQGFFLDCIAALTITYPPSAMTATPTVFYGLTAAPVPAEQVALTPAERLVTFELAGTAVAGGPTLDRATALYFRDGATEAWDAWDASKLAPLGASATLAFLGQRDGVTVAKAEESRALEPGSFEVPISVQAIGTAPELTLTWPRMENVPAEWGLVLRDLVTGTEIDLRSQSSYTFTTDAAPGRGLSESVFAPPVADVRAAAAPRFVLAVTSVVTAGGEGAPAAYALHGVAPNPIASAGAVVRFDLPEAADARLEVFDMLGRRVATLAEGARAAGRHAVVLDASSLPSGVYVVRMTAGAFVQAQRVTIAR